MSKKDDEGDALFDDDINGEMAEVKVEPPESPAAVASSSSLSARYVNLEMSPSFSSIAKPSFISTFVCSTFPIISQKARMERNRMKALSLKRARLTARATAEKRPHDAKTADRSVQGCHLVSQTNFHHNCGEFKSITGHIGYCDSSVKPKSVAILQ